MKTPDNNRVLNQLAKIVEETLEAGFTIEELAGAISTGVARHRAAHSIGPDNYNFLPLQYKKGVRSDPIFDIDSLQPKPGITAVEAAGIIDTLSKSLNHSLYSSPAMGNLAQAAKAAAEALIKAGTSPAYPVDKNFFKLFNGNRFLPYPEDKESQE